MPTLAAELSPPQSQVGYRDRRRPSRELTTDGEFFGIALVSVPEAFRAVPCSPLDPQGVFEPRPV